MSGQPVRTSIRAAFIVCGLGLIAAAIVIALRHGGESISLAALLTGVLLVVIGGTGRLPEEIGLQRISFDRPADLDRSTDASSDDRAMVDVVRQGVPALLAIAADQDGLVIREYWLDELEIPILIIWAPDGHWEVDQDALETALRQAAAAGGIVLLTNAEEIHRVASILRSRQDERAPFVRWRSRHDNEALRRAVHRLSKLHLPRRKRAAPDR